MENMDVNEAAFLIFAKICAKNYNNYIGYSDKYREEEIKIWLDTSFEFTDAFKERVKERQNKTNEE